MATKKATVNEETLVEEVKETKKEVKTPERKYVTIFLPKDDNLLQDDVLVTVNFRTYQVKRGVEVSVPIEVAEVLRNSQLADSITLQMRNDYAKTSSF